MISGQPDAAPNDIPRSPGHQHLAFAYLGHTGSRAADTSLAGTVGGVSADQASPSASAYRIVRPGALLVSRVDIPSAVPYG